MCSLLETACRAPQNVSEHAKSHSEHAKSHFRTLFRTLQESFQTTTKHLSNGLHLHGRPPRNFS